MSTVMNTKHTSNVFGLDSKFLKPIWKLSWPTVVYTLLESSVGLIDIYLVSYIGADAVAAIGFSRQIFLVLMIGTLSITTGTITLISQYCGAKDYNKASLIANHSMILSIASGILFGLLGVVLSSPILYFLGAREGVLENGTAYLQILMGGVIFLMINFSSNAIFRALGDTKTPLKIATLINALNVVFSYVLIFGFGCIPRLGVQGAALGTVLARAIGGLLAIYRLTRPDRSVRLSLQKPIYREDFRRILNIGLPSGFSGFFRNGARILFFRILAFTSMGSSAIAVATIGFQIRMYAIMPALAFQVAIATLVGQSIGSNQIRKAEQFGWTAIRFCSILMALASVPLILFPGSIVRIFSDAEDVLVLGNVALRFIAIEQFCNCMSIVISGVLSGAGDTKPSLRFTILSQWILMLPAAYALTTCTQLDLLGAWIAWGIAPSIQLILTFHRFLRGTWKTLNVALEKPILNDE